MHSNIFRPPVLRQTPDRERCRKHAASVRSGLEHRETWSGQNRVVEVAQKTPVKTSRQVNRPEADKHMQCSPFCGHVCTMFEQTCARLSTGRCCPPGKAELHQKSWEGDSAVHLSVRCDHHIALQLRGRTRRNVYASNVVAMKGGGSPIGPRGQGRMYARAFKDDYIILKIPGPSKGCPMEAYR